jgi:Cu2+-exporting ATPase
MDPIIREYLRYISLFMTLPVALYSAWPFYAGALAGLRARHVGMDVPVALGIALAFVASVWNTFAGTGEVYYDSVVMFVFLLLLGRYVEMLARHRAGSTTEALVRLVPATAMRVGPEGRVRVPVAQLSTGDRVVVPVGECFPADGTVSVGETQANEALLTGESQPVPKSCGSTVVAGSLNMVAPVEIEVGAVGQSTVIAGIVRLLERAQTERPRIARVADRAATWFVTRDLMKITRHHPELRWAGELGAMIQVSMIGYAITGAFLSLAYYDLPYNVMAIALIGRKLANEEVRKLTLRIRPAPAGAGLGARAGTGP